MTFLYGGLRKFARGEIWIHRKIVLKQRFKLQSESKTSLEERFYSMFPKGFV